MARLLHTVQQELIITPSPLFDPRHCVAQRCAAAVMLLVLLAGPWLTVRAETVDAFVARLPVADGEQLDLDAAFEQALEQVLVKLSGSPEQVALLAELDGLGAAGPLVIQRGFVTGGESEQRLLEVRFSEAATRQRLTELGLPIWPLERPTTLVWAVIDRGGDRSFLGSGADDEEILQLLTDAAEVRAIPLLLPLLDLEDLRQVSITDVWGGFVDAVRQASDRYEPNQVMLIRAFKVVGNAGAFRPRTTDREQWATRWVVRGDGFYERWESRGADLAESINRGMAEMAGRMGRRFAVIPELEGTPAVQIRVYGIRQPAEYSQVLKYLAELSVVNSADPVTVTPDYVDFSIDSPAGLSGFTQAVDRGRTLQALAGRVPAGVDRVYQLATAGRGGG
ncbi:MAG: DUF2066 domain-containing protein [Xanthomonadales bacterium]|nr:DUF2066 domain-containing protein [Xanthomonadales bacterium]